MHKRASRCAPTSSAEHCNVEIRTRKSMLVLRVLLCLLHACTCVRSWVAFPVARLRCAYPGVYEVETVFQATEDVHDRLLPDSRRWYTSFTFPRKWCYSITFFQTTGDGTQPSLFSPFSKQQEVVPRALVGMRRCRASAGSAAPIPL